MSFIFASFPRYDTCNEKPYKDSKANEYNFISYIDIMFTQLYTYRYSITY